MFSGFLSMMMFGRGAGGLEKGEETQAAWGRMWSRAGLGTGRGRKAEDEKCVEVLRRKREPGRAMGRAWGKGRVVYALFICILTSGRGRKMVKRGSRVAGRLRAIAIGVLWNLGTAGGDGSMVSISPG